MRVVTTRAELAAARATAVGPVGVVMTMGALHEGHASLLRAARAGAGTVLMTLFVNPLQFGPNEDFARYPRTMENDLEIAQAEGVDVVFAPSRAVMYPGGEPGVRVNPGPLGRVLEGESRPGFFDGVLTVVLKLLHLTRPDLAFFGEKDFQQLTMIRAMVRDTDLPVEIVGVPTVREPDGLAMSSRNVYLDAEARRHAVGLHVALLEAKMLVEEAGEVDPAAVVAARRHVLEAHHVSPDYATVRHPTTLAAMDSLSPATTQGVVALIAGRIGGVRLIDNMVLGKPR
jgi:pantoate--beta-alanine ligase